MIKNFSIKVGEKVRIISGDDKFKTGEVIKILKIKNRVIVKGINIKYKHNKPKNNSTIGKITFIEKPIDYSNIQKLKNI